MEASLTFQFQRLMWSITRAELFHKLKGFLSEAKLKYPGDTRLLTFLFFVSDTEGSFCTPAITDLMYYTHGVLGSHQN